LIDKYVKKDVVNPGMFCSQLVAAIFELLQRPLDPNVPAEDMSPNAISKSPFLVEVPDVVTMPDDSATLDENTRDWLNSLMRQQISRDVLPSFVAFRAVADRLQERADAENARNAQSG
jgi:hypothetical protein